jgi:hypothetical protein
MHALVLLLLTAVAPTDVATIPTEAEILKPLRREHPRLVGLPEDLQRVKKLLADDPRAAEIYKKVQKSADKILGEKPVEHKLVGPRLLGESRKCLDRVYTLATVYRLGGDRRYAERAIKEMLAAAAFKDWNPSHFLDTAEMTHALAIGYDWLYQELSPEDRKTIRQAIVEKGLREAEKVYRKKQWWSQARHNWNQVCNGGISIGALAVAEDEPQLAAYIVHQAVNSVQLPMREFAPDGAWAEGPGYWGYATSYNVYMLAALESALGTDFGLSRFQGFPVTGDFRMHFVGPTRETFNFADAGSGAGRAPQMFWLARKFDQPLYAWHERDFIGGNSALHLWWFDPRGKAPTDFATDRWFRATDVVFLRSKWDDPRAVFVGFKGGDNKVNHSHLELGTFVLDAAGQRWAVDLGSDDYNMPAYFGNKRWTYYRLGTVGQNTLLIDGQNQDPKAVAPIVAFASSPQRSHAVADLTAAYGKQVKKAQRGMALLDRRQVLVQDEIESAAGTEIVWQMHTKAKIELQGDQAVLTQGGEKLVARILSPATSAKVVFAVTSATPPPPENQNVGVSKLVVKLTGSEKPIRLAVLFTPSDSADAKPPAIVPLAEWKNEPAK